MNDIEKMNFAIAKFENRKFNGHYITKFGPGTFNELPEMKYHIDWNWLMVVVEMIDKIASISIRPGICTIDRLFMNKRKFAKDNSIKTEDVPPISECNEKDFIGNVHQAVYDFVVWYYAPAATPLSP